VKALVCQGPGKKALGERPCRSLRRQQTPLSKSPKPPSAAPIWTS